MSTYFFFKAFCLRSARVANARCAMGCASGMRMCAAQDLKSERANARVNAQMHANSQVG